MEKKKLKLLSLFSGIGAPEKALTNLGIDWELINFCEIDKYASKSYCAIHGVDESLNLGDITKVDESKLDKDIDILTFGFPCVPKGSLVKTEEGYKTIEDIQEGDKVLTHKNRYRAVLKTMMRTSDHINTIRGVGCYGLRATDEHPLYINRNGVYRWIQVKDIKEGDRITYNINQHSKQTAFSDEELWILGRYVADGYLEKHSLQRAVLCIGKSKIQEFESFLNKTKYEYVVYHKERNCCEYKINDCSLTSFIKANIGTGSKGKFISQAIINLDKSKLIHFLEGYFSGDGFRRKDRETWMFTTVSEKVFLALQDIIIKLFNLVPSVYLRADTRKASFSNNYCCSFSSCPKDQICSNGQISVLVKNVKREHKATDVYNIEVEEDNSYVVNNVIVHNCQDISVAGKQKGLIDADGNKTRSGLFFDALRIIKATRPKIAIAENVKALTQKKFSEQFRTVLDSLSELGYDNYWDILNASGFGIPQERESVYRIDKTRHLSRKYVLVSTTKTVKAKA